MSSKFLLLTVMEIANWYLSDNGTRLEYEFKLKGDGFQRTKAMLRQIVYSIDEIMGLINEANT